MTLLAQCPASGARQGGNFPAMPHPRKFRFGIQLSTAPTGQDWMALARKAEDLGYSTLFVPDHFGEQLAPIPALMAAADATTDLRLGALVLDNDYRHPVVLAKEIATLDVLSNGRIEFGIGAGWMTTDYEQSGIPKDRDGVRIDRMVEALEIYRGAWAEGSFNFKGEHYTITDYDGLPKPLQQPSPPILIGGGGPRVLRIAAQHADIVGINPRLTAGEVNAEAAQDARAEMVDQKVQWVKDAAGDRFDELELNILVFFSTVTDDARGMAEGLAGAFSVSTDEVLEVPYAWFGTVDAICDKLRAARERWNISYFVVQGDAMEGMAPVVAALAGT
jgi:probable F420-dependent oxidoreductase